eukprot:2465179-Amphidinium_carterae.1
MQRFQKDVALQEQACKERCKTIKHTVNAVGGCRPTCRLADPLDESDMTLTGHRCANEPLRHSWSSCYMCSKQGY